MSTAAPTTVSPATQPAMSAVSSLGSFVVDSYSPTQGGTGILFTVNLTCTNIMSAKVVAQLDIRLVIDGKYIYSKLFKGINGQVTLRALLGDSLASLPGRVPLCMLVFDNGSVFDSCVFGDFYFVAPIKVSTPPGSAFNNSLKRSREENEPIVCPDFKRTRSDGSDDDSVSDACQATLVVETDINELANVSSWSEVELQSRRRLVRLSRKQRGSNIHLYMKPMPIDEAHSDDRNLINCFLVPGIDNEAYVSSVDIIRALEILVNPSDGRLTIEEKNRVRRNIDTLRPKTLKRGDEGFYWLTQLPSPRPITIAKDVKIFKWSCFETALEKIMRKYAYHTDGSFLNTPMLPQQASSGSSSPSSWLSPSVRSSFSDKSESSTASTPASTPAAAVEIVQPTPRRPAMSMPRAPPSPVPTAVLFPVDEYFNEAFPATVTAASASASASAPIPAFDFNAHLYDQSESSLASASLFSESTVSSTSGLGFELLTPVDAPLSYSFDDTLLSFDPLSVSMSAPAPAPTPEQEQKEYDPIMCSEDLDTFLQDMLKPTETDFDFESLFNDSAAAAPNAYNYDSPLF